MKKYLFVAMMALFAFSTSKSYAQDDRMMIGGLSINIPVGDWSDIQGVGFQADFQYLFGVADNFYVGPMAALTMYTGKTYTYSGWGSSISVKSDGTLFLPIGGSARYLFDDFFAGLDLGYGIGLSPSGNNGGFYFKPKAGYNFGVVSAVLSYSGIAMDGVTAGSFNIGAEYQF